MSTRKGYRFAVAWLGDNDDNDPQTVEDQAALVTTCLVADLFGYGPERVAKDVLAYRAKRDAVSK